jgi:hypothetical protein
MRRVLVVLVLLGGCLGGAARLQPAVAETGTPVPGHHHAAPPRATPGASSPYADRYDPAAAIRSLTPEDIAQIERGEGAGFALAAELNGVPGPRHVLDLAHELDLSHDQVLQVQAVYDQMQAIVAPAGRRYLDALRVLEEDFRAGTLTERDLFGRVAAIKQVEAELVAGHLMAHLQTAEILTTDQIAAYTRLRGYE